MTEKLLAFKARRSSRRAPAVAVLGWLPLLLSSTPAAEAATPAFTLLAPAVPAGKATHIVLQRAGDATGKPVALTGSLLFSTALASIDELTASSAVPDDARARAETFARRARAFRSRLPAATGGPGPQRWTLEKRRRLERDLVAFIDAPGIEEAAAAYAAQAAIFYEWEGLAEGPIEEASSAERYLDEHRESPLRPYLLLFLAHRYRCADETQAAPGAPAGAAAPAQRYRFWLNAALNDTDPLVRFLARDIAAQPYLYLEGAAARSSSEPPPSAGAGPCSDTAIAEAIPDPEQWALRCFGVSAGPEAARPRTLMESRVDIDGDGVPELFIGSTVDRGNAGGVHYVFRQAGAGYSYLGSVFLHPDAWKPLPPKKGGEPRLLRYVRLGAGEGLLETVAYDGSAFVTESSEHVAPLGKDRARLCRLLEMMCDEHSPGAAPALRLREALDLADAYVSRVGVDLSEQHLRSAVLQYDESERMEYWHLQWTWTRPRLGGEFGLRVYLDGRIVEARLGP